MNNPFKNKLFLWSVADLELRSRLEGQAINQPAILCYTSGTTANPKGALLSQVEAKLDLFSIIIHWRILSESRWIYSSIDQKVCSLCRQSFFLNTNHVGGWLGPTVDRHFSDPVNLKPSCSRFFSIKINQSRSEKLCS